jgi:hypothetical protein
MLTFKQYLKEEALAEAGNPFYHFWGFIDPDGKVIEKTGEEQESEGCHEKLAAKLGLGSKREALRKGWVRWGVTNYNKTIFFDYGARFMNPYSKNAVVVLADKYEKLWNKAILSDEWSGKGGYFTSLDQIKKEIMR